MAFLPKDYTEPIAGSRYLNPSKLPAGQTKIRILSDATPGWVWWEDNKPTRVKSFDEVPDDKKVTDDSRNAARHFWVMVVYNYEEKTIQVMEVVQAQIRSGIMDLVNNPDWGDPKGYNITISKKGEGLDTEYGVQPSPKTPLKDEIKKLYNDTYISVEALFHGEDPFTSERISDQEIQEIAKEVTADEN